MLPQDFSSGIVEENCKKSQVGLLRSLLYQYLRDHRELIPIVLSEALSLNSSDLKDYWTLPRLKRAFIRLINQDISPLKICIFADGLDEYEGDYLEITRLFMEVTKSKHVKIWVSSRPLLVFDQAFKDFPGLKLQNLTFDDIRLYVQNRIGESERMQDLIEEEPDLQPRLISEILFKATGVFLWVKLVVQSLMEGLDNFDTGRDLERRLHELPSDIEDLYWHMLDRVKPSWYLEEGFRLLLIVNHAGSVPLTLRQLCFAEIQNPTASIRWRSPEYSIEKQEKMCIAMEGRVKSRCLGLLEISTTDDVHITQRKVHFLHKSVSDFLDRLGTINRIAECRCLGSSFNANVQLLWAYFMDLKHVMGLACLTRDLWFDVSMPLLDNIMRFAQYVEEETRTANLDLLDELDNEAKRQWSLVTSRSKAQEWCHWSYAERLPQEFGAPLHFEIYTKESGVNFERK